MFYGGVASNKASCALAGEGREEETYMFNALEPKTKAEASTRRALEKCMFGRWFVLVLESFECVMCLEG